MAELTAAQQLSADLAQTLLDWDISRRQIASGYTLTGTARPVAEFTTGETLGALVIGGLLLVGLGYIVLKK